MSIADDIRNMNAEFKDSKVPEVIRGLSLDDIANAWQESKTNSHKENQKQEDNLKDVLTPELFTRKLDEYMSALSQSTFNVEDFAAVSEFCGDYLKDNASDEIKNKLANLQEKMAEKRGEMKANVDLKMDDKTDYASKNFDSINIESQPAIVGAQQDKKNINGKTITFKNEKAEDLAGIEFDEKGSASILLPGADENSDVIEYRMTENGNFGVVFEDKVVTLDPQNLKGKDLEAYNYAQDAKKVWNNYTSGKLDSNIIKPTKINEGKKNLDVNEGSGKDSTKIDEKNKEAENDGLDPTVINEGSEAEPNEADVTGDDPKDKPSTKDELYWKEGDIIDTMFKEWFLAAANSATNWVVHQIEYAAAGIWKEFEESYSKRKIEREKEQENINKAPKTSKVYDTVTDIQKQKMDNVKKQTNKETLAEQLKSGKIQEAIESNPYLAKLHKSSPAFFGEMLASERLKDPKYAENCATILSGFIVHAEAFSNKYALTSIMDDQLSNKDAFENKDLAKIYDDRQKDGMEILLKDMAETKQIQPEKNLADTMDDSLKRMTTAETLSIKDFTDRFCDECGYKPHKNKELLQFQNLLDGDDKEHQDKEKEQQDKEEEQQDKEEEQQDKDEEQQDKDEEQQDKDEEQQDKDEEQQDKDEEQQDKEEEQQDKDEEQQDKDEEQQDKEEEQQDKDEKQQDKDEKQQDKEDEQQDKNKPAPDKERTLSEEAKHELIVDQQQQEQREEVKNEEMTLDARQEHLEKKREKLRAYQNGNTKAMPQAAAEYNKNKTTTLDVSKLSYATKGGR